MQKLILYIILAALCLKFRAQAQTISPTKITGKVTDEQKLPLPGATIKIQGTNTIVLTDNQGSFAMTSKEQSGILLISFLGYKTMEVGFNAANASQLSIILKEEEGTLKEVEINAGYYTVKDRERTGSISRVTAETISKQPINNPLQALQGRVPGVDIVQATGVPGGGFTVQIRGRNSIAQGNDPFYVIDGVPFNSTSIGGARVTGITPYASPLISINPSDIESIEVLKDADATAIYGSRGANGVILITTKKGNSGIATGSVIFNQGISRVAKKLDLMNTSQYLEMRNEAFINDKLSPSSNQYDVNGTWSANTDIDWQKELIGGTAPTTNLQTSLLGGNSNIQYLLGGSYYNEGTVFPGENSFNRNSGNFSLQYASNNKKFNTSFSANYSKSNSDLFTTDLTQFILLPPNYPKLLNSNGVLNWENNTMYINPLANIKRSYNTRTSNLISNALVSYTIIPGIQIKTSFGYTAMNRKEYNSTPLNTNSPAFNFGSDRRIASFANNVIDTWIVEPQASWNNHWGTGKLNLLIGSSFQQSIIDGQNVTGSGYTSDALLGNIAAASVLSITERQYLQYRYAAVFGRLNYVINNKYILNATARRDGSSRFGQENRFSNFGAFGVAWIFSGEKFIAEKLPLISFGKLRTSFGITGNDQIGDYAYLELWNTGNNTYQGISTISPSQISNPNYAWEINKKAEVAMDLGLLKDRINLSVGFYTNRSSNQLIRKQLPPGTGFTAIQDNLPAIVRNTGWEFELSTKNISGNIFNWNTSVNVSVPINKLVAYPDLKISNDAMFYEVGYPLSILKIYNTSVDLQTGLYVSDDYDKNELINDSDRYLIKFLGKEYYGGIQNSFNYKGMQLDFLIQIVKQYGDNYLGSFSNNPGRFVVNSPTSNQPIEVINRWKEPGDASGVQKASTLPTAFSSFNTAKNYGILSIEDASFIRLKNISLSYNLPNSLIQKIRFNQAKFYIQGQNVLTITKYKGFDPETQSINSLPLLQVISAGVQCTF